MSFKIIPFLFYSILIISPGIFTLSSCRLLTERDNTPKSYFNVSFLNVRQGDASLISSPDNRHFLIDAGNEKANILSALRKRGVLELAAVIITHPDLDHFGAITAIMEEFKINRFILPNDSSTTIEWSDCLRSIRASSIRYERLFFGDTLVLSEDAHLKFLWPVRSSDYTGNSQSYAIKMIFGGSSVFFPGDIDQDVEFNLLRLGSDLSSEILKVAHHGSRTSSALPFLAAVDPLWAVISCDSSVYGHPHAEVVNGLNSILGDSSLILRTDRLGDLDFRLYRDLIQLL